MELTDLIHFYHDCDYWPADAVRRPRELHLPKLLSDIFSDNLIQNGEANDILHSNKKIEFEIDENNLMFLRSVMLHESLFHFYKGFYNYLAARNLYFSGMIEWIKITIYYSKFYFARSLTSLIGIQSYWVSKKKNSMFDIDNPIFLNKIAKSLASSNGKIPKGYRIRIETDVINKKSKIVFDKNSVSSHHEVWSDYQNINIQKLDLHDLLIRVDGSLQTREDNFPANYIISQRNEENYSFEGYAQLDFNLSPNSFEQFFKRDDIKDSANILYDFESSSALLAFATHLQLFRQLSVDKLPLQKEKISFMIKYCLPNSLAKEKLLLLCDEDFQIQNLYSGDGDVFYDNQDRTL